MQPISKLASFYLMSVSLINMEIFPSCDAFPEKIENLHLSCKLRSVWTKFAYCKFLWSFCVENFYAVSESCIELIMNNTKLFFD